MKKNTLLLIILFYSYIGYAQWQQINSFPSNETVLNMAVINDTMIVSTGGMNIPGIFVSNNHGLSWSSKILSMGTKAESLINSGSNLYAGTWGQGVYVSTDKGYSWVQKNNGLPVNFPVTDLIANNSQLYVCGTGGIFYSANNAGSWQNISLAGTVQARSIEKVGNTILSYFSSQTIASLYKSINNGTNWTSISFPAGFTTIRKLESCNNLIFASNGVNPSLECAFVSSDTGNTWTICNGLYDQGFNFSYNFITNNGIYYLASDKGVYKSIDNGLNWTNFGLNTGAITLAVISDTLYAGTGSGMWKRGISQNSTSVEEQNTKSKLIIFPNPTNDKLQLQIDKKIFSTNAVISIYNIEGQLISQQSLLNNITEIDISNFKNGMYILKLINNKKTEILKFVKK